MSHTGLAIVEEVVARLQRGRSRAQFERDLKALLKGQKPETPGVSGFDDLDRWAEFYGELGMSLFTPPTDAQKSALAEYGFRPIFMPVIGEDQYPPSFVKLAWGKNLDEIKIQHLPLPGRIVAVETIAKPNWDDRTGYPNDKLVQAIGLDSRFGVSWDELHKDDGLLVKMAATLGFPSAQVRCPSAKEWNFAANVLNHLRTAYKEDLPDWCSTNSWEWCENSYESDSRLVVGYRVYGGLSAVYRFWHSYPYSNVGFRVLVQF